MADNSTDNSTDNNAVYHIALSTAISTTCVLSIFGSLAIIISYVAFRELRTTMRYLLFNLSIADLIVAVTNLFGALYSLKYLDDEAENRKDALCTAQAAIGLVGVDSSIIWTVVFIVYIYVILVCYRPKPIVNLVFLVIITFVSWILPIAVVIVFVAMGYFGYDSGYSPAFCTIDTKSHTQWYRGFVGYEMFFYSSFLILPIFSLIFFFHLCYISVSIYLPIYHVDTM